MSSLIRCLLALLLLWPPFAVALAAPRMPRPAASCDSAVAAAGDSFRLPPHLLLAIAEVESGRPDPSTGRLQPWPWTINADGEGAFFPSKAQAIAAVRSLQARGVHSIDVGCMQVNLMFHPAAFASLDDAFDPRVNALYAARFLTALHAGSHDHDWLSAIAAYHSQTQALGADYRRRVLALWQDPSASGWYLGLAVAYRDFAPRSVAYADFAPRSLAYGAFAPQGADPGFALHR
ncbi:MAG TPA: transglycosylase SLT domain-containing protein [Acetobacteraceae bacterium]|nr:transglycosylase SLT domain-containing protein [Acetobacteraceae bacterium]